MNATLTPLCYELDDKCPSAWPASVSLTVVASYPFLNAPSDETPSDFVVRAYLETLWMPEVIAPLAHFIPSLRRVSPSPNEPTQSPILSLVTPLLLATKDITTKYRTELPALIEAGGSESSGDDPEEAMIVFAWTHEKRGGPSDKNAGDEADKEARWTKYWLQRYERRETMVQVLLHFFALALPSSSQPPVDKKRKRQKKKAAKDAPSFDLQENLDILTDRLCIWREGELALTDSFIPSSNVNVTERDWLQSFCEDVVRPNFATILPPLYDNFRLKCFPELASAGDETDMEPPTTYPSGAGMKRAASSSSRQASMEPSSFLDSLHPPARQRSGSTSAESLLPPRTFSRSNSVASSSQGGSLLNQRREVSMRRSVSVQRDINGKGKGKEVAQPNGKSSSTATLKAKTKPGKSAETRVAKSASFSASAPNLRPDAVQSRPHALARTNTTIIPETPSHTRTFGRSATLNDFGARSRPSQITFNDDTMLFDEPSDSRSQNSSRTVLVQSTPVRPRARALSVPESPDVLNLIPQTKSVYLVPESPAR